MRSDSFRSTSLCIYQGASMYGKKFALAVGLVVCFGLVIASGALTQQTKSEPAPEPAKTPLQKLEESLKFAEESLKKSADELMLFHRLEDIAEVDKSRYTGPPPRVIKNPTAQGAGNPVLLSTYTFIPKKPFPGGKRPLI